MRNILVVAVSAVVMTSVILVVFWPGTTTAEGPNAPATPLVADPQLQVSGCTVKAIGRWEKNTAVFEITATNSGGKSTGLSLVCSVYDVAGPGNIMSRVAPRSTLLTQRSLYLALGTGESKTCRLEFAARSSGPKSALVLHVAPEPEKKTAASSNFLLFTGAELVRLKYPAEAPVRSDDNATQTMSVLKEVRSN